MIYFSHLMNDNDMKKLISHTGGGIESIEFSVSENLDQLSFKLSEYEKRLDHIGSKELLVHGPFLDLNPMAFDSLVAEATRTRYEQAYEAAKVLGAKKIIYHTGFVPTVYYLEGWAERMVDFYVRFLENKSADIQILMENVLDPFPEPLAQIAENIVHPAFGVCLDIGHANCYSVISLSEWMHILTPYIRHLHVHDNCGVQDSHLALGDGNISQDLLSPWLKCGMDMTVECNSSADCLKTFDKLHTE